MAIYHLMYRTNTAGRVPAAADMPLGRLAVNLTDERLFFKNTAGVIVEPQPRSHTHPTSEVTGLQTLLDAKANSSVTLTAGNGLTGGGSLAANRTFTLGTPGTLTGTTTNAVQSTSHTHQVNLSAGDVGAIPTAEKGAANGVATLDTSGKVPTAQLPSLPSPTATTLSTQNLNDVVAPGDYAMNTNAGATSALNYPVSLAGILTVQAAVSTNQQITQTYVTNPASNVRTFRRIRFGSTPAWGSWFEIARVDTSVAAIALVAATDANSLLGNARYTWANGGVVVSGGTNWPPVGGGIGAGFIDVHVLSGTNIVYQRATFPAGGGGKRTFERIGGTTSWEAWRAVDSVPSVSYLPTADAADVYVNAAGVYRWNGSAYVGQTLVSGQLQLMPSAVVNGTFGGEHSATSTYFASGDGDTYIPSVPGTSGTISGFIARSAANVNSKFVALTFNQNTNFAELTYSKHGTATAPGGFRFISDVEEAGRIRLSEWIFGPYIFVPNVSSRQHVFHTGGGTQYGTAYRPQLFANTVAIQFQAYNGLVAGFIQNNSDLSVIYSTTSDYRAKDVIGRIDPIDALQSILDLQPIRFRMKGVDVVRLLQDGFVAHELQEVIPGAVTGYKDETREDADGNIVPVMQGVDLSKIVPRLVGAIQRQQELIDQLMQRVDRLEINKSS